MAPPILQRVIPLFAYGVHEEQPLEEPPAKEAKSTEEIDVTNLFEKEVFKGITSIKDIIDKRVKDEKMGREIDERIPLPPIFKLIANEKNPKLPSSRLNFPILDGKKYQVTLEIATAPNDVRLALAEKIRSYGKEVGSPMFSNFRVSKLITPWPHGLEVTRKSGESGVFREYKSGNAYYVGSLLPLSFDFDTEKEAREFMRRLSDPKADSEFTLKIEQGSHTATGYVRSKYTITTKDMWPRLIENSK